jgi:prepilin-type N-terminal cleavage/methylation domain
MKKAFTLIELLVVIAIIGLLSTIAIVSLNGSRSKARDARRLSDIKQCVNALEIYYAKNGAYPGTVTAYETITPGSGALHALETDGEFKNLPIDPQNGLSAETSYYYGSPGWWDTSWPYQIQFQLENRNDAAGLVHSLYQLFPGGSRWMYSVHP